MIPPTKIFRCIRTNEGTAEEPVYSLHPEDGGPAPSSIIAPEDPPVLGADGLAELWYWTDEAAPLDSSHAP